MSLDIIGANNAVIASITTDISTGYSQTALDMYNSFCAELGVDSSISLASFNSDDKVWVQDLTFSPEMKNTMVPKLLISSEGAIGFYNIVPKTITRTTAATLNSIYAGIQTNIIRYFDTYNPATIKFVFHGQDTTNNVGNLKSYETKFQQINNGFCLYIRFGYYAANQIQYDVAIFYDAPTSELKIYITTIGVTGIPVNEAINIYALTGDTTISSSKVNIINSYNLGKALDGTTATMITLKFPSIIKPLITNIEWSQNPCAINEATLLQVTINE